MSGSYLPLLVVLSAVIAVAASYVALDLAGRVTVAAGRTRLGWLAGGALAMGVGIWSMHFTGMLAFRLHHGPVAMPMMYDMPLMALSVVVAVAASALALAVVGRPRVGTAGLGAAGVLMGGAICGMHYIGMASMRMPAALRYRPPLVGASIAVAVAAAFAALWLAYHLRSETRGVPVRLRAAAAALMGGAIAGMHYTAMAAAVFTPLPPSGAPDGAPGAAMPVARGAVLATQGLAGTVVVGTLVILGLALLGTALDRRVRAQLARAAERERLLEAAERARAEAEQAQEQLQHQAVELEFQVEEAQALAEELEQTNQELHDALLEAESARAAAERSEAGFRQIFEASPLPMWVYDGETLAFREVNAAAVRHYGYSREAFLAMTLRDIRPPEEQAVLDRALALRAEDPMSRTRTRHRTRDGSILEVEVVTQEASFAGPGRRLAVVLDMTERVRAQRRERFLAEASRALGASLDYQATLERVAQLAVPALADWCGVDLTREPGDPRTLEQVAVAHVDPARVEWARELRRRYPPAPDAPRGVPAVVRTGRAEFYADMPDEMLVAAARDAEHLRLMREVGFRSAIVVPLAAHGRVLGALTLVTAESGRRYAEADLALAEELGRRAGLAIDNARRYEAEHAARDLAEAAAQRVSRLQTLTAALAATRTFDEAAAVIIAETVAATGARTGILAMRAPGADHAVIVRQAGVPPEVADRHRRIPLALPAPASQCLRTGEPVWAESRAEILARFGGVPDLWERLGAHALAAVPLAVGGDTVGAMSFTFAEPRPLPPEERAFFFALGQQAAQAIERARLYEAERAARAAAEDANRAKSQFLANMSHELRTPLNAIGGHVQLLEMGLHGPVTEAQREALGRVWRAQEHLLGLITDVLNYAQLEAGRIRYALREVALAEVLGDVAALVAPLAGAKQLVYDVAPPDPALHVRADPEKLRQVLLNLLSNAIKFTPPGGRVAVDVIAREPGPEGGDAESDAESDAGRPPRVFVRVSDTGVGIPADKLEAVFAPFVQVESGFTRATGGTGLGLAISRDLARGMGGDLRARSQTGVGSTFTLTLPMVGRAPARVPAGSPEAEGAEG